MIKKRISKIAIFFTNIILIVNTKVQALTPAYGIDYREPVRKTSLIERIIDFSWILVPICWIVGIVMYYKKQNKKMKYIIAFANIILCSIVTYVVYWIVNY